MQEALTAGQKIEELLAAGPTASSTPGWRWATSPSARCECGCARRPAPPGRLGEPLRGLPGADRALDAGARGYVLNPNLENYHVPTVKDIPVIEHRHINVPDSKANSTGAKGIGEPPVGSGAGAFVCAVEDALGGTYPSHQPLTPDKLVHIVENGCLPCSRLETHV